MDKNYLKPSELAKYSSTTKRTIRWYNQIGLIMPVAVGENGYKDYLPEQIIDLETIQLLQKFGFSLNEIKNLRKNRGSLKDSFLTREKEISQEIQKLNEVKSEIKTFYLNLNATNYLVNPKIEKSKCFNYYYIEKIGPYEKIPDYFQELKGRFAKLPQSTIFLVAFNESFNPQKTTMRIGLMKNVKIKSVDKNLMEDVYPSSKILSYTHEGSPRFLSLLWDELSHYRKSQNLKLNKKIPHFFEFYIPNKRGNYTYNLQIPIV